LSTIQKDIAFFVFFLVVCYLLIFYTPQDQEHWPIHPEFEGELVRDNKTAAHRDIHFYLDVTLYDLGLDAVGTNRQRFNFVIGKITCA